MAIKRIEEIASLTDIDEGRLAAAFTRHMKRAIADCEDRPADKKARVVTIQLAVVPTYVDEGYLQDIGVEASIRSKVPDHVTLPVNCRVKRGSGAVFNDMNENDVDQKTIDELGA